uniref:Uncharacterized protein n=1 Tax=Setaria viridis TaxID=4556 RepID=A0A4V6D7V5_SETVI|nr:hypothetical protein SEVIR_4G043004v2 [Setaria viridis]
MGKWGNIAHHTDVDKRNGSVTWSTGAGVMRPPRVVFFRGDESEVESNCGCGEAPARCFIMVATARQSARGLDSVVSLCQVECGVCSGTLAEGPVWWWPSRCGAVCFHQIPCRRRITHGVFGDYTRVNVGGCHECLLGAMIKTPVLLP